MSLLLQLLANGIVNGTMFAVLAIGFGLVYRSARAFHVAYGAALVLSAFVFYSLVAVTGLGLWAAGVVAVGFGALFGWGMEAGFYGPFFRKGTANGAVIVASLGLGFVIENSLVLAYGNGIRAIPRDFSEALSLGPVRLTTIQLTQFLVCGAVLTALAAASKLRFFRIARAMAENAELLQVHGWRLGRYRAYVFALSGALAAVPASLVMADTGMDVHAGMSYMLLATVAVIAGGVAHMRGWVLGGVALAVVQSLVVWKFSARWMDLVSFTLLLAILLFRREGLFHMRKRVGEA